MAVPDWFARARFGLFVHWGAYSQHGWEPSWPLVGGIPAFPHCQDVPVATYYRDALRFAPKPGAPREWMRLAQRCGMSYAVLTTKHHDGFTLFACDHSDFGVAQAAVGRDVVAEFVQAARAEGLRVGLYFSLADWHHPDYPAFADGMRPYPFLAYPRPEPARWARFLEDMRAQLTHLLTAYGTIDLLWFDGGWERSADEWQARDLEAHLRSLQPGIVINDRLPGAGDYDTPEQCLPGTPPARAWETCMTMNHSWGNVAADREWKSTRHLVGVLTEVASGGGNLLLNVSPDGEGRIPAWQQERLEGIAAWMDRHGEAIVGTERGLAPWQFHGPTTRKGARTYLFCPMRPQEFVVLRGVHGRRVTKVRTLGTGRPLPFELRLAAMDRVLGGDPLCDVLIETPDDALDPLLTVIEVEALLVH
ncbi:MAG: alpha-L-fucosidase [Candidatus Binatia bacterium]